MNSPFRPLARLVLVWFAICAAGRLPAGAAEAQADLVVVGGTPGGIMAAIAAARSGQRVLLLERTAHLGGLPANGLGATDIGTRGATGGLFLEFTRRVRAYYVGRYGESSPQVENCSNGYHFEPSVGEAIMAKMVAEQPKVTVLLNRQFESRPDQVERSGRQLNSIQVLNRESRSMETVRGAAFIDATYEGDLAAAAGVRYRLGREDARDYGEPLAGVVYKAWNGPVGKNSTGLGDNAIQSYNFRVALTNDPANRVAIGRPPGYRREDYASLIGDLRDNRQTGGPGAIRSEMAWDGIGRVVNMVQLPNGKTDANNQHAAFVSTDLPEENWPWPTASWAWRDQFAERLRNYTLGLLWFCQNEPELPAEYRARSAGWGLPKDEYLDNDHFPRQVYVREGRRIIGQVLFTAHDALPVSPGKRPPVHADSVTASHYSLDSHAVRKREPGEPHLDGFFSMTSAPYTVPYGVMVPPEIDNLLVPVAASTTHVGFSTLRMEPCWMALGEAAGTAASQALHRHVPVQQVDVHAMQLDLLHYGAVLYYFRDLPPSAPNFEAIEMLALRGLLPEWTARAGAVPSDSELKSWCSRLGVSLDQLPAAARSTRGAALAALWRRAKGE